MRDAAGHILLHTYTHIYTHTHCLAESVNAHKSKVPKLPALNVAMAS